MQNSSKFKTVKKILHAGKGEVPNFELNTKAILHYEVLLPLVDVDEEGFPDNKDLYKSIDNTKNCWPDGYGNSLELIFGKKFQLPILETCVSTMLIEEISQFDIHKSELNTYPIMSQKLRDISRAAKDPHYDSHQHNHHCAFSGPLKTGYKILNELLKKPQHLRFIIHLMKVIQPADYKADSWQMNNTQKLERLEKIRLEGNNLFKKGCFEEASNLYGEALSIIETLLLQEKPHDEEWIELDKKNIPFYLNLSQCFLCLSKFYEAAETASEVLKRDPNNEKARFRRAKARIAKWDLDLAEDDLKILLEKHPLIANLINEQLLIIKKRRKEKDETDKTSYKAMFKSLNS